jgi:P27 family predicted phage terminase small subunit
VPRGRPPKPSHLKLLSGNPGKRPLNAAEPRPKAGAPACPAWLSARGKARWKELVPELSRLGLLTVVDGDALAGYCQACAELAQATETLDREGRYQRSGTFKRAHPALAAQREALAAVRQYSALFGLDPSSRSKISAPGAAARTEADDLEAFIG